MKAIMSALIMSSAPDSIEGLFLNGLYKPKNIPEWLIQAEKVV